MAPVRQSAVTADAWKPRLRYFAVDLTNRGSMESRYLMASESAAGVENPTTSAVVFSHQSEEVTIAQFGNTTSQEDAMDESSPPSEKRQHS